MSPEEGKEEPFWVREDAACGEPPLLPGMPAAGSLGLRAVDRLFALREGEGALPSSPEEEEQEQEGGKEDEKEDLPPMGQPNPRAVIGAPSPPPRKQTKKNQRPSVDRRPSVDELQREGPSLRRRFRTMHSFDHESLAERTSPTHGGGSRLLDRLQTQLSRYPQSTAATPVAADYATGRTKSTCLGM